jgi:hypothetical protein
VPVTGPASAVSILRDGFVVEPLADSTPGASRDHGARAIVLPPELL